MKSPTDGRNAKLKPDNKEQSERFIETAKELEADKNADAFDRAFRAVVPPVDKDAKR